MRLEKSMIPTQDKQDKKEERKKSGRTTIDSRERGGSFSPRTAMGKKWVDHDEHCPRCGHHKSISTIYLGNKRCTRCGYNYVDAKREEERKKKKR